VCDPFESLVVSSSPVPAYTFAALAALHLTVPSTTKSTLVGVAPEMLVCHLIVPVTICLFLGEVTEIVTGFFRDEMDAIAACQAAVRLAAAVEIPGIETSRDRATRATRMCLMPKPAAGRVLIHCCIEPTCGAADTSKE
jgi:hypothetical protein